MKYAPIIAKLILVLPLLMFVPTISHAATATIKIYPTDDVRQELYDEDSQSVWSVARSYTGTFARPVDYTSTGLSIRSDNGVGVYRIYRASLLFNTSIIPDSATIQSATMNVYKLIYGNNTPLVFTQHSRASTTNFVSSDWQLAHYGTEVTRGILNVDQYTSLSFNSNGLGSLNPTGYTDIGAMTAFDYDDIDPGSPITSVAFASSEAGTSTSPYLEITYTVPDTVITTESFDNVIDMEIKDPIKNKFFKMWADKVMGEIADGKIAQARQHIETFRTLMKAKKIDSQALNSLLDRLLIQIG